MKPAFQVQSGTMTTALITGANKGLGFETARRLADLGWTIHLGARDPERGEQAAAQLSEGGGDVRFVQLDVTSYDSSAERSTPWSHLARSTCW